MTQKIPTVICLHRKDGHKEKHSYRERIERRERTEGMKEIVGAAYPGNITISSSPRHAALTKPIAAQPLRHFTALVR